MAQHLSAPPRVRAAGPFDGAEGEPSGGETVEAGGGEGPVAQQIDDNARALESGVLQIDAAARVAERGIAGCLEGPSDGLAQHMGE